MEWTYPSVPERKGLLLLLVSCGRQPIIGSVRTPVAYSIGIPFSNDDGTCERTSYRTEHGAWHGTRNVGPRVANYTARTNLEIAYGHHANLRKDMEQGLCVLFTNFQYSSQ